MAYIRSPGWSEHVTETVYGRPTRVWSKRPRHVLDLLDLAPDTADLDLLVHGNRRISFAAFREAVEVGAAELASLGVTPGDRVLIVLYNSPEFLLAQWAIWRLGAVPVLGNRWWSESDLRGITRRIDPVLLITDMEVANINDDASQTITPNMVMKWWRSSRPSSEVEDPREGSDEDDVALMEFTAGSAGVPKGVQLSCRNIVWTPQTIHNMRGGRPPLPKEPAQQQVAIMTTPMFHNGAMVAGVLALVDGSRIVIPPGKFDPVAVLSLVEKEGVTSWNAVPTMLNRVLRHPDFDRYDLSSLIALSTGGSMVPQQLLDEVKARLPHAAPYLAVGYGMTEMSFLTMALAPEIEARPGTVGKPVPGVEIRILNPSEEGDGEIVARNAALMVGYFNTDEQPIDDEGWYHTGDVGRIDDEGYVYVTGRTKDMIIRGGENIACPHVEAAIVRHDLVNEIAVIGYPDEEFGEAVAAVVAVRAGADISAKELEAFARERLAYFEVPTKWFIRDEPLPVLPTGKVDKHRLSRELADRLGTQRGR